MTREAETVGEFETEEEVLIEVALDRECEPPDIYLHVFAGPASSNIILPPDDARKLRDLLDTAIRRAGEERLAPIDHLMDPRD